MPAIEGGSEKEMRDMNTMTGMHSVAGGTPRHVTAKDVCELFTEEIHSLYLLSFLLMADQAQAEQCLIAVLGEGTEGIRDFLDWASASARIAILTHAIRMIRPVPLDMAYQSPATPDQPSPSDRANPFAAIASLGSFERFVFVMSVLEGRSDDECATLLVCTRREVVMARELAQQVLAISEFEFGQTEQAGYPLVANSLLH
jgi:hypothetical protein